MGKRVGIVSYGIIQYGEQGDVGKWADEATFVVARQALDKVGLSRDDIDVVVISTMDGFDGITISNGLLVPAAGAYEKESVRIENGGIHCVMSGMASILSDSAEVVIVASADTVKTDFGYVTNSNQDQFFRGPLGFNAYQSYGLMSMDYMRRSGATEKDFATAASRNYQNGKTSPFGHVRSGYTTEEIMASRMVSWPLRELEIGRPAYGASAVILASEEKAKQLTKKPIWLTGIGAGTNNYSGSWSELSGLRALKKACAKAYSMAGIKNPKDEFDFVEVLNVFSPLELMAYEALGICKEGEGVKLLWAGETRLDGKFPVNPSGGALCTNAYNSGAIYRIIQSVMCLNNENGAGKLANARRCLVHDSDMGIGAVGGDSHAVLIMEKGR